MQLVLLIPTMYHTGVCNSVKTNSQKSFVGHPTITGSVNDNINIDSTITGSVNDNINMDSTITGSVDDNINMDNRVGE